MIKHLTKKELLFSFITIILASNVFYFNSQHLNQDFIFYNHILPIAKNLVSASGYLDIYGAPAFYPMWGYVFLQVPGVLLGFPEFWTLSFQFALSLLGILFFYKLFNLIPKLWHIPLFLPYFALCSIKTADGIVAALFIFYAYFFKIYFENKNLKHLLLASIILAFIVNLRSEYIYFPFFQLFLLLLLIKDRIIITKSSLIIICVTFISLLPWAIRSQIITNELRFTSSNGGAVMYISLGQLPNNAWGIVPVDSTAYSIAGSHDISDPFSHKADKIFKQMSINAIKEHPFEFFQKMLHNTVKFFTNGLYTGEYANFFIGKTKRAQIDDIINQSKGKLNQLKTLFNFPTALFLPIAVEKILQITFTMIFLIINIILLISFFRNSLNYQTLLILSIIIFKILIIAVIQYEYRHTTGVYLLILGLFLSRFKFKSNN